MYCDFLKVILKHVDAVLRTENITTVYYYYLYY